MLDNQAPDGPKSALDLSISIIDTDNKFQTLDCLASVFANLDGLRCEVCVVDNASSDGSAEAIANAHPDVRLIQNATRMGFATNNNQVIAQTSGINVLLLNDDTVVQPGALRTMVTFLDLHPEAGAVGGHLLNVDGTDQQDSDFPPNPIYDASRPFSSWLRPFRPDVEQPAVVGTVCGACMMVRRMVIDQVGALDPAFDPIYSEEVDWCERIRAGGWRVVRLPNARVIHLGSQTMNRAPLEKIERLHAHKARFYLKHRGRLGKWTFKLVLFGTTLLKLAGWIALWPFSPRYATFQLQAQARLATRALFF